MRKIPELTPRLSVNDTLLGNKKGKAVNLRPMYHAFKFFGAFGSGKVTQETVALRMYDREPKSALDRFDNILRGYALHSREIEFFRMCIAYILNDDDLAASIPHEKIRSGKAHLLVRDLFQKKPSLDFNDVDPLIAILAHATGAKNRLILSINQKRMRTIKRNNTNNIEYDEVEGIVIPPRKKFYIHIDDKHLPKKLDHAPLVFNFSNRTGACENGNEYRGQFLYPAKKVLEPDPKDKMGNKERHYWCSSDKGNKAWEVEEDPGMFGFLVLGNAGNRPEDFLPPNSDPDCVSNSDLQYMYSKLAQSSLEEDDIVFGLLNYTVTN